MARSVRIDFEGAIHHVIVKGNNDRAIFLDEDDNASFLKKLYEFSQKYPFKIYAYCLMKNHFHLLIETGEEPLYLFMQRLLTNYVQWFNKKYELKGHLLGDRYKAILVDKENYFLTVLRYIHFNPVKANIVENIEDYKWSSYNEYINKEWIVSKEEVLLHFDSLNEFIEFHKPIIIEEPELKKVKNILFYGEDSFIQNILAKKGKDERKEKRKVKIEFYHLEKFLEETFNVNLDNLKKHQKGFAKQYAILILRERLHQTWEEIAKYWDVTPQATKKIFDKILNKEERLKKFDDWVKRLKVYD